MKNFLRLSACLLATCFVFGCTTVNKSQFSGPLKVDVSADLKADVAVGEKISGSASATQFLFFTFGLPEKFADGVAFGATPSANPFGGLDPLGGLKAAAAYDAVAKSGADVIVAPQYLIERNDQFIFKTVNVTVSGYKGMIKGIK